MSEKLNELKKATMASYLAKAGSRVRSGTSLGKDFEKEKYKHMAVANKHHPNMVTPGFEKDPEKLKSATAKMDAAADLEKTFKRDAANRIKGIARAGRLLAKEETLDEVTHQISVNHKHVDSFKKDLDDAGIPHKPGKKSLVGNYATVAVHAKHVDKAFKIAGNRVPKEFREEAEQIDERNTESHPSLWDTHELKHESGKSLKKGDKVKGFRGTYKIQGFEMPHHSGSTGRVYTDKGSFFPSVVNAKIVAKEEVEPVNEVSRSTIAKVAQARYNQAQKALKDKNYAEYVSKMKKAIKASDATTPKTGWSHEEETQLPEAEPIVEVSAQEKYRQIRESKVRNRKGK